MRLIAFQIKNYKSIKDTGLCYLSDLDRISVLAGQNESGKSSVLQAIYDFEMGSLRPDAERLLDDEEGSPEVTCVFQLEEEDKEQLLEKEVADDASFPDLYREIRNVLSKKTRLTLRRVFDTSDPSIMFEDADIAKIEQLLEKYKAKEQALTTNAEETPAVVQPTAPATVVASPTAATPETTPPAKPVELPSLKTIASKVHSYTPVIVLFDDQQDLLPPSILISDLVEKKDSAQGYQAVMNLQKAFGLDLVALDQATALAKRLKQQDNYSQTVTVKLPFPRTPCLFPA